MVAPTPEAPAEITEPEPGWGLIEPLVAFVCGVIGSGVGASVAAAATGAPITKTTLATTAGALSGMWVVYVAAVLVTSRRRGSGHPIRDVRLRLAGWQDVALGTLAGVVTSFVLVNLVYFLLEVAKVIDRTDLKSLEDPARELTKIAKGPGFLVLGLFVGIGAPIVEEIFFRGFLQPAAVRRFGPVIGVVFTAVFFAAAHLQPLQFPALAVFGLVLGVLAYKSKRLGPGIVAHIVFNCLTLAALAAR